MPLLRPPPWAGKPACWLDKPLYYGWALEELDVDPFSRHALSHVDTEWISIAMGLSEPYLVNSVEEIVYVPYMSERAGNPRHG